MNNQTTTSKRSLLTACERYFLADHLSITSTRLYLADIKRFLTWLSQDPHSSATLRDSRRGSELLRYLPLTALTSPSSYTRYFAHLHNSGTAPSTAARSQAALKKLGEFITSTYFLPNPTQVAFSNLRATRSSSERSVANYNYIKYFTNSLKADHLSDLTIKSYKSDVTRYIGWSTSHLAGNKLTTLLETENIDKYLNHLHKNTSIAPSTLDRKLASLTRFKDWYASSYPSDHVSDSTSDTLSPSSDLSIDRNFCDPVPPSSSELLSPVPPSLFSRFRQVSLPSFLSFALLLLLVSGLAFFGYRAFSRDQIRLTQAYPAITPVSPNRQLSFQGRLEDSGGTPITSSTNLTFKLFDDPSAGSELYSSGTCAITPDADGIFSTQIGDECGSAIGSNVFTEYANVYLEVTVVAETLTPRQQIATVAYALNSETIQGFPLSSTVSAVRNTVVAMNNVGQILVGEQSPRLTGVSGTFQISAPALSLTSATGTSGNIAIAPDGTGQVNVTGNTTSTNFFNISNAQLSTGSLITGTVANNNTGFKLINLLSGTAPSSKFFVTDAGETYIAGNLGIGTTSPGAALEVNGQVKITGGTPGVSKVLTSDADGLATWQVAGGIGADSLDFIDFEDTLDLDANLILNQAAYTWVQNFTGDTTTGLTYNANSLTTGTGMSLASTSTAGGASGTSKLLNLARSGANSNASHTAYGIFSDVTNTGTTSTNIAGYFSASGATNNYSAIFANGNIGIGTTAPQAKFDLTTSYGKTDTSNRIYSYLGKSNDSSNYSALQLYVNGGATANDRQWIFQTIEQGISNNGSIIFQPTAGNVGIGTTGPNAKLDVAGNIYPSTDASYNLGSASYRWNAGWIQTLYAGNGTVDGPSISFKNDIDTGFYYPGTNSIGVTIGGADAVRINSSGNLGIGTTNPGYKLEVAGNGYFSTTLNIGTGLTTPAFTMPTGAGANKLFVSDASGNASWSDITSVGVGGSGTTNYLPKWTAGTTLGNSQLFDNGTFVGIGGTAVSTNPRLYVNANSGNVGIGTTSPGTKLEVSGNINLGSSDTGTLYFGGTSHYIRASSGIWYFTGLAGEELTMDLNAGSVSDLTFSQGDVVINANAASKKMRLQTQDLDRVTIDSSGNVGIGTTSPGTKLEVSATTPVLRLTDASAATGISAKIQFYAGTVQDSEISSSYAYTGGFDTGTLNFFTKGAGSLTQKMIIDSAGNVGIGTTNPLQKLHVSAGDVNVDTSYGYRINNTATSGQYLRGDGTRFVSSAILVGDLPTITSAGGWTDGGSSVYLTTTSDNVGIGTTNPVNKLTVTGNANFTGNVGIGTTTPTQLLNIEGTGTPGIRLVETSGADAIWELRVKDGTDATQSFIIWGGITSQSERLVITGTGSIGIGTTVPTSKLHVVGDGYFSTTLNIGVGLTTPSFTMPTGAGLNKLFVSDASGNASWTDISSVGVGGSGTTNYLPKWTAGTILGNSQIYDDSTFVGIGGTAVTTNPRLYVNASSGNVGIGGKTPNAQLHIFSPWGYVGESQPWLSLGYGGASYEMAKIYMDTNYSTNIESYAGGGRGDLILTAAGNVGIEDTTPDAALEIIGDLMVSSSAAGDGNRLIVNSSGNVGIGLTVPLAKLHVSAGDINVDTAYGFRINNTATSGQYLRGDGTRFVSSAILVGDLPTITSAGGWTDGGTNVYLTTTTDNVGIGTTAPTAKLQIVGGSILIDNGTSYYQVKDSGGNARAIMYVDSADTTYYQSTLGQVSMRFKEATDSIWFLTGGNVEGTNTRMVINSTGNVGIGTTNPGTAKLAVMGGNVGIGTASPTDVLSVAGNIRGYMPGDGAGIFFNNSMSGGSHIFSITRQASPSTASVSLSSFGGIGFATNKTSAPSTAYSMVIDTTGNVGIGTTTPGEKLSVEGQIGIKSGNSFRLYDNDNSNYASIYLTPTNYVTTNYNWYFAGNVGIGTTNPLAGLHVGTGGTPGSTGANDVYIQNDLEVDGTIYGTFSGTGFVGGSGTDNYIPRWDGTTNLENSVMYDNGTNIGIGTTAPSEILHIEKLSSGSNSVGLRLSNPGAGVGNAVSLDFQNFTTSGQGSRIQSYRSNAGNFQTDLAFYTNTGGSATSITEKMRITDDGNVGIGTTNPGATLHVVGTSKFSSTVNFGDMHYLVGDNTNLQIKGWNSTDSAWNTAMTIVRGAGAGATGNVGIGTTNPSRLLSLSSAAPEIIFIDTDGGDNYSTYVNGGSYILGYNNTDARYDIAINGSGGVGIGVINPNASGLIVNAGNVGIGTTSPATLLELSASVTPTIRLSGTNASGAGGSGGLDFYGKDNAGTIKESASILSYPLDYNPASYRVGLDFSVNNRNVMTNVIRITGDGNVGIGTTNPLQKLHVSAGDVNVDTAYGFRINNTATSGQYLRGDGTRFVSSAILVGDLPTITAAGGWTDGGTNVYLTTTSDNVGIGTTNPNYKLDVTGTGRFTSTLTTTGITNTGAITSTGGAVSLNASSNYTTAINTGTSNGAVTIGGNSNTVEINSSNWDVSTAGAISGLTGYTQSSGNFSISGTGTFGTGTGAISLNGDTTIAANKNLSLASGTGVFTQTFTGTTTNAMTINANSLSTGKALYLASTSTALSTGNLLSLDWSPTSATTATGDLFSIGIGASGTAGNLFNILDSGSSLFSISETAVTSNLPTSFTSSGDVAIAYDLLFTNQTASYIKSNAPLYLQSGESFESNDLTLQTYNAGDIVLDTGIGTTGTYGTIKFYDSNVKGATDSTPIAFADTASTINTYRTNYTNETLIGALNEVYAAATGATGGLWTRTSTNTWLSNTGDNVGIGTTGPAQKLDVVGNIALTGNIMNNSIINFLTMGSGAQSIKVASLVVGNTYSGVSAPSQGITVAGNVGIGTTAPGEKLSVKDGDVSIFGASRDSNLFLGDSGSGGAYGYVKWDYTNDYLQLGHSTGGVKMTLQEGGNVGIGTTGPGAKLDVVGDVRTTASFNARSDGASGAALQVNGCPIISRANSTEIQFLNGCTGYWQTASFYTDGSEQVRITNAGNVGIGTTNPLQKLHVSAGDVDVDTAYGFRINNTATSGQYLRGDGTRFVSSAILVGDLPTITAAGGWTDGGTNVYLTTTSDNVGIGTTNPGSKLDVQSAGYGAPVTSGTTQTYGALRISPPTTSGNVIIDTGLISDGINTGGWIQSTNRTSLGTNYSLFLNPNGGNVGIGTTNPGYKLEVNGDIKLSTGASRNIYGPSGTSEEFNISNGGTSAGSVLDLNDTTGSHVRLFVNNNTDLSQAFYVYDYAVGTNNYLRLNHTGSASSIYTNTGTILIQSADSYIEAKSGTGTYGLIVRDNDSSNWVNISADANVASRGFIGYLSTSNGLSFDTSGNFNLTAGDLTVSGGNISVTSNNGGIDFNDTNSYWLRTATNYGLYWDTTNNTWEWHSNGVDKWSVDLSGNTIQAGTLSLAGTLSDSDSDLQIADHLDPSTASTYDLGDATNRWRYLYVNDICFDGGSDCMTSTSLSTAGGWTDGGANVYLTTSTDNVGIGTTGPSKKLEIAQDGTFANSSSGSFSIIGVINANKSLSFGFDTTSDYGYILAAEKGVAYKNLILNPIAGNVGIGTTNPGATLEVAGNSLVTGNTYIGTTDAYFYRDSANRIATPDDFYVQSTAGNTYLYATNTYLGNDATDSIRFRGSEVYGDLWRFSNSTGAIQTGSSTEYAYNRFGAAGTNNYAVDAADVYVQHDLEVDGTIYGNITGSVSGNADTTDNYHIGGSANYVTKFNAANNTLVNSVMYDDGTNIGIGIASPSTHIQIYSNDTPENASATPLGAFSIKSSASTAMVMGVESASPYEGWIQVRHGTVSSNTYPLSLQPLGNNVGIGTTNPGQKLDVVGGAIRTNNQLISTVATGTAPLAVSSTTKVANLNADLLDDYNTSMTAGNSTVVVRNGSGYVYANYFNTTADVTATAATHFAIQTGSDSFVRWQTPANARTSLGIGAGGAGDIWVEKAGDTMTGNLTMGGNHIKGAFIGMKDYGGDYNYLGDFGDSLYKADVKYTCTGDCSYTYYDNNESSYISTTPSATPIVSTINFNGGLHYWNGIRIHFAWNSWTNHFKIEYLRDTGSVAYNCNGTDGDESWVTYDEPTSLSSMTYTNTGSMGSWVCGMRFTFYREVADLNDGTYLRIGDIMAYQQYYNDTTGKYANTNGFTMYGTLDAGSNLITNIGNTSTDFTSGGGLTLAGTFDPNGAITFPTTGISGAGTSSGLDADKLEGYHGASASTVNTFALRDASGDINTRLFRSEYTTTNPAIGYIMTQVNTGADNYIRPSTPAQLVTGLGLEAGGSRDIWVEKAGDTMTGPLVFNATNLDINRIGSAHSGISWYGNYASWSTYMSNAGTASSGPRGNLITPSGTYVTSWGLRNYIESNAGYGWTFESASGIGTTNPAVKFEIRSSDGLFHSYGAGVIDDTLSVAGTGTALTLSGASTTAINISNTGVTTDISLQNGETIDNDTNGRIKFTGDTLTSGNTYFANGTTYYVNTSGNLLANVVTANVNQYRYNATQWAYTMDAGANNLFSYAGSMPSYDVFEYATVNSVEYYSGGWLTWSGSNMENAFDHNVQTGVTIDATHQNFRFVIDYGAWSCQGLYIIERGYVSPNADYTITIETDDNTGFTSPTTIYSGGAFTSQEMTAISVATCTAEGYLRMQINATQPFGLLEISALSTRGSNGANLQAYKQDYTSPYVSSGLAVGYSSGQSVSSNGLLVAGSATIAGTGTALTLSGASTTAINISNTGVTTDISLQYGETIDNNTDGRITFGGADILIGGNDILDSAAATRITLGANTYLTNTTTTLSGTSTLTASSLATFTTAASLGMTSTTALTLGTNASITLGASTGGTIYGSSAANGNLTLEGTSNGTKTTSYVILQPTSSNVGIGTTTPSTTLYVSGDITGNKFWDGGTSYYLDPGDGTTSISVSGNIVSDGAFTLSSNGAGAITLGTTTNTVNIGAAGTGKLNAATIDPPYTINGSKYATYVPSMTGIKEETTGKVTTSEYISNVGYRTILDFATAPQGSDLWLFAKTTSLKTQLSSLVVLLSPSGNTQAWYRVNGSQLEIYSSSPTTISYRLTAPRFDASSWSNTRQEDEVSGLIINDTADWSSVGQSTPITPLDLNNLTLIANTQTSSPSFNLYNTVTNSFITETKALASAVIANLRAGLVQTEKLQTNLISPLASGSIINVNGPVVIKGSELSGSSETQEPLLTVDGTIDTATISARVAKLKNIEADNITAKNIVADTISANHIEGLDAKIASLSAQNTKGLSDSEITTITDRIKARLAELTGNMPTAEDIPLPPEATSSATTGSELPSSSEPLLPSIASDSATLAMIDADFVTINNYLAVIGQATVTNLDVTDTLSVNTIQTKCSPGSELSGSSEPCSLALSLQPLGGTVKLASNTLIVDSTGQVFVNGDLSVSGKLTAQTLSVVEGLTLGTPADATASATPLGQLLTIYNEQGIQVASIDASGSANLANVATQLITIASSGSELCSDSSSEPCVASQSALAQTLATSTKSNATAGSATLTSPNLELTIESKFITADSLVYLTPTSATYGKVLYVKTKNVCHSDTELPSSSEPCRASFTVAIDTTAPQDITFNWWIIQLGGTPN